MKVLLILLQKFRLKRNSNKGFTLIEILVVIIIIGVLSAIALPSFLNQAARARQTEAKLYIGTHNRAQLAYRLENSNFASDINQLEVGIPLETDNYTYQIVAAGATVRMDAAPKDVNALRSYAGGVVIRTNGIAESISCQSIEISAVPPIVLLDPSIEPACGAGAERAR